MNTRQAPVRGVAEGKPGGGQALPARTRRAIPFVAYYWMPDVSAMDAQLVGSSRNGFELNQSLIDTGFEDAQ